MHLIEPVSISFVGKKSAKRGMLLLKSHIKQTDAKSKVN